MKKDMMKTRIWGCIVLAAVCMNAMAQGGTKSPYSQYGVGALADVSQSMNRGMNGVGLALQEGNHVNTLNPASYAGVDSLTMLFDAAVTLQATNYKEGSTKQNGSMASLEYVVGSFRARKGVGMAFGVRPFSSVGYSYSSATSLTNSTGSIAESYSGSGGLHEVFLGVGWQVIKPLSVGANLGYLWGDLNRSVTSSGGSNVNTLLKTYTVSVSNYKLEVGAQWKQPIGRRDRLSLGATVGIGHQLKADPEMSICIVNTTGTRDTTTFKVKDGLKLPMTYGVGAAYNHKGRLTLAADFTLEKWGSVDFPAFNMQTNQYVLTSGLLKDRTKVNVGMDWLPTTNVLNRNYLSHVHYRMGAGLATPYYKIGGQDGPKELSVSAGLGIPVLTGRSLVNVSFQWARTSAKDLITENSFRLNIGVTFNERWFAKWKVE
jgi:hypothetical protein